MTFSKAIDLMKMDSSIKVHRLNWNGKGMYLFYVRSEEVVITKEHPFGRIFVEGTAISMQPYIAMKTVEDTIVPWLASQSDMLAEDWEIFHRK
jgi:hypothetical protein